MNTTSYISPVAGAPPHHWRERLWKDTLYLLLDLPVGVVGFTAAVTGLAVGASLIITLIGIPLIALLLLGARLAARAERARAGALLGIDIQGPARVRIDGSVLHRIATVLRDGPAWRSVLYFVLMLPAGVATFTVAVTWWATTLMLITLPAWAWALPNGSLQITDTYAWTHPWQLAVSTIAGVVLALASGPVMRATTAIDRAMLNLLR